MSVVDLTGIYTRLAERADDADIRRVILALRDEPQPYHPHIEQGLNAFTLEAAKRGLEIDQ